MRRTLYLKLLTGYVAFGILAFLTITTFTTRETYRYLREQEADNLYREAKTIASIAAR